MRTSRRGFMGLVAGTVLASWAASAALHLTGPAAAARRFPSPAFPLRISADRRHLAGADGKPFLLQGDAGWSLIADQRLADAELYLDDRRARGFSAILINLIEHKFARRAPDDIEGEPPFLGPPFERPNDAYFERARQIVAAALKRGLTVLLAPSYLGFDGGDEGWYREMAAAGPDALFSYGAYVGRRFAMFPNVIWVEGGDYNPPDKALVRAVATGIRSTNSQALHSVHPAPDTVTRALWQNEPWFSIDTVYAYRPIYPLVRQRVAMAPPMPVVMFESTYENEQRSRVPTQRAIAYGAMLGGAAGHIFGNNPIWHFDGPGLYRTWLDWRDALASPGAQSMTHLRVLLDALDWWKIRPDEGLLLPYADPARSFAGVAGDGSFALVYVADGRHVTVDRKGLANGTIRARWFDPSAGMFSAATAARNDKASAVHVPPAPVNAAGATDWLLVLTVGRERSARASMGEEGR